MSKKRDFLLKIEQEIQGFWENEKIYESNASSNDKYFATFPYPYMNGKLHMGHSFSVSKPEFQIRYQRMLGKNVLFPMGFHCTGMPIKAASDKIKREIEMFGKDFSGYSGEEEKVTHKHSKDQVKTGGLKYQFQILQQSGIPIEEIAKFADPNHWIYYFPPLAINDLKRLGCHVDWRRSFITTNVNPYYDSFIRWQFNHLHSLVPSKVQFGERFTIYSPLDGQACMDHDRKSGEGVGVQEYTGIKLKVLMDEIDSSIKVKDVPVGQALTSADFKSKLGNRVLYMVAATLRPETMYGQTNCYVGVDLDYGVYEINEKEAWVCTARAARNMAYQNLFQEKGKIVKLADLKGWDLVGLPLSAPLSSYPKVFMLPMEGVLATKGTGVVTSVPSDSPDDFITMMDLQKKAAYYNIQPEWVTPFLPPKPIINTPKYGDLAAVTVVNELKIKSQKDKENLAKAKEMVYKEGFYNGTIIVGSHAGMPVQEAKPLIRQELINQGLAFPYCEPESRVVSRSGDECVVGLTAQWYMDYGEDKWKAQALECLSQMELFSDETRNAFEKNLDWLKQWACSRSYGLGSRLPWDPEWLIESLSDSTIYMAYYTVAHLLHADNLDGSKPSHGIKPEDMTDEVWSYIMVEGAYPKDSKIPKDLLEKMRKEFNHFYPLDLRTSAKDLINNHLTFFIYNHVAIFPKKHWPKGIRANGYLLLNNEKMSKSTGNFMNMCDSLDRYGADATRFALADAGDGMDDANFVEKTADDAVLKLFNEREWISESLKNSETLRKGEYSWNDRVFEAEMNNLITLAKNAYDNMLYREVIKIAFYDLQHARNEYRKSTTGQGLSLDSSEINFEGMHIELIQKFAQLQALLMCPITPHWSENIWMELLGHKDSIIRAKFPEAKAVDHSLIAAASYVRGLGSKIRSAEDAASRKKKKGKSIAVNPDEPKKLVIYIASEFPSWQEEAMKILQKSWDFQKNAFSGNEKELLKDAGLLKDKRIMPFVAMMKKSIETTGPAGFNRNLEFSEKDVIDINLDYLRRDLAQLKIKEIEVKSIDELMGDSGVEEEIKKKAEGSMPGQPTYDTIPLQ